jgi:hypothetical protein
MSQAANKFSPEEHQRAVRRVLDHEHEHPTCRWRSARFRAKIGCTGQIAERVGEEGGGRRRQAGGRTDGPGRDEGSRAGEPGASAAQRDPEGERVFCSGGVRPPVQAMITGWRRSSRLGAHLLLGDFGGEQPAADPRRLVPAVDRGGHHLVPRVRALRGPRTSSGSPHRPPAQAERANAWHRSRRTGRSWCRAECGLRPHWPPRPSRSRELDAAPARVPRRLATGSGRAIRQSRRRRPDRTRPPARPRAPATGRPPRPGRDAKARLRRRAKRGRRNAM